MSRRILVVAAHPDDETLGCGGSLLRWRQEGHSVHWVIVTEMTVPGGYTQAQLDLRGEEIKTVAAQIGFATVHRLGAPTCQLDRGSIDDVISPMREVVAATSPTDLLLPWPHDAHSDHRVAFDAALACSKWFRQPGIRRVLCYETLSETELIPRPGVLPFQPSLFVNIEKTLESKLDVLKTYTDEVATFPFPRSERAVQALARRRGAQVGLEAAEAFHLLREVE